MYQWEQINSMSNSMMESFTSILGQPLAQSISGYWLQHRQQMEELMKPSMGCTPSSEWSCFLSGTDRNVEALIEGPEKSFKAFSDASMKMYEDMSKILNLPQLGLTRSYQERTNRLIHEFNRFTIESEQLIGLIATPMEKTFIELEKSVSKETSQGKEIDDPQHLYRQWIAILEKHYLQLFNSPEFISALHSVLYRYSIFNEIHQEICTDLLKFTPMSSKKDLDALAKENYTLKKEVKKMNRRVMSLEGKVNELSGVSENAKSA